MISENLQNFKRWAIIALFSDDDLAETFALKGGSALELIYKISTRASIDIDVSMKNDFPEDQLPIIEEKLKTAFSYTFDEHGYNILDFSLTPRPLNKHPYVDIFWGGYRIEFKIHKSNMTTNDIELLRKTAEPITLSGGRTFSIDISKYEYLGATKKIELDDYFIYVYTLELIVYEKLRALCQQLPDYPINKGRFKKARTRDFYDIYTIMNNSRVTFNSIDINMLKEVFQQKKVPIEFIFLIEKYKKNFSENLSELLETLPSQARQNFNFDKYFSFTINGIKTLNI